MGTTDVLAMHKQEQWGCGKDDASGQPASAAPRSCWPWRFKAFRTETIIPRIQEEAALVHQVGRRIATTNRRQNVRLVVVEKEDQ